MKTYAAEQPRRWRLHGRALNLQLLSPNCWEQHEEPTPCGGFHKQGALKWTLICHQCRQSLSAFQPGPPNFSKLQCLISRLACSPAVDLQGSKARVTSTPCQPCFLHPRVDCPPQHTAHPYATPTSGLQPTILRPCSVGFGVPCYSSSMARRLIEKAPR